MAVLFLTGHFLLFLILSLIFNFQRLDENFGFKVVLSFLEAISAYLLVSVVFLYEFIAILWAYLLHLFLIVPAAVAVAYFYREINENWDWVLENIKNHVLFFLKVLLPLYVFLTVFQNQPLALSVVYSVAITAAIMVVAYYLRKLLSDRIGFMIQSIQNSTRALLVVWIVVGIFCAYLLFFWHPDSNLAVTMNLADHISFWDFLFHPVEYIEELHTPFPLYTQFGMLAFIPIIVGAIFPISNYRKCIQVIDINTAYGIQKETKKQ